MNEQQVKYLFEMVRMSPYVQENHEYRKSAATTEVEYIQSDVVNAYASRHDGGSLVVIYAGICEMSTVAGYALASGSVDVLKKLLTSATDICRKNKGSFGFLDVVRCINQSMDTITERMKMDAESFASGCVVSIFAHELGHICLHHIHQPHYMEGHNDAISRNNERSADLFASSIVTTTPFAGYMIPASLLVEIFLGWISAGRTKSKATTHPHSRERALYIFNSHIDVITEYGITEEFLMAILAPEPDSNPDVVSVFIEDDEDEEEED